MQAGDARPDQVLHLGRRSAVAVVVRWLDPRALLPARVAERKPARVEVQLDVLPGAQDAFDHAAHRCVAEVGGLQHLDKEGCRDPVIAEGIKQKAEAVLMPIDGAGHVFLADRPAPDWVGEGAADTELRIDRDADFRSHAHGYVL